jgi:hypothetical protein
VLRQYSDRRKLPRRYPSSGFASDDRIRKLALALRPSTLLAVHQALVRGKYRRLFSSRPCPTKRGPNGPADALIRAIGERKSRNPRFGCPRMVRIVSQTFGAALDTNVVSRVLKTHYRPAPGGTGLCVSNSQFSR